MEEVNRHLVKCDEDAVAFHESCELAKVPISFGRSSYQATGLIARLHELAADLLKNALHLVESDETNLRAHNRCRGRVPPARKGGGIEDCTIIEEYFGLCRLLQGLGFARKTVFCSSNTQDYQAGAKLHELLAKDFENANLKYKNTLQPAVHELKTS
jgi:hypothetical protein